MNSLEEKSYRSLRKCERVFSAIPNLFVSPVSITIDLSRYIHIGSELSLNGAAQPLLLLDAATNTKYPAIPICRNLTGKTESEIIQRLKRYILREIFIVLRQPAKARSAA